MKSTRKSPKKEVSVAKASSVTPADMDNPRFSALPVRDLLKTRMKDLGILNVDLQKALSYPKANVISMIRGGSMSLPAGKSNLVADILKIDRTYLLLKLIAENDPELSGAIASVMGDRLVSANEMKLVLLIRSALNGHDIDVTEFPEITEVLTPALEKLFVRHDALARAAIKLLEDWKSS
jgi:hypothetical protein